MGDRSVVLAAPQTYMNLSGESLSQLIPRHGIDEPGKIVVVHDEIDLPVGALRIKIGGGSAGNNGIRSVDAHLGTPDYARVRIGVGRPANKNVGKVHVLAKPSKDERSRTGHRRGARGRRRRDVPLARSRRDDEPVQPPTQEGLISLTSPLSALPARLQDDPALTSLLGRQVTRSSPCPKRRAPWWWRPCRLARSTSGTQSSWPCRPPRKRSASTTTSAPSWGPERVVLFPAWEILPFERVSPSTDTMGSRLEILWRLSQPDECPDVVVAPVRAIVQTMGPHGHEADPIVIRPGDVIDPTELVERLVARVAITASSRSSIAARWPCAAGSSTSSPRPPTVPIRIDMWGDEVERLTEFSVADQRSTVDRDEVEDLPRPRAAAHRRGRGAGRPTDRARAVGARELAAARRRRGLRRHGVLAAVARRRTRSGVRRAWPITRRCC